MRKLFKLLIRGAIFTGKMNELIVNFGNTIPSPQMIKMMSLLATKGKILPLLEITDAFIKSLHAVFTTAIPAVMISLIIAALFVKGAEHLRNTRLANKNS